MKMKINIIRFLFLLVWTATSIFAKNPAPAFPPKAPFYSNQDIFVRSGRTAAYGIPMVDVSAAGTVFAVVNQRLDTHLDSGNEQKVVLRRSFDSGKTWRPEQVVAEAPLCSAFPTGLVCDNAKDKIFIFYRLSPLIKRADGKGYVYHQAETKQEGAGSASEAKRGTYVIETSDEGETWSEPRYISDEIILANGKGTGGQSGGNGIQLEKGEHKGRLLVSNRSGLGSGIENGVNCVFYSDDHGQTWQGGGWTRTGVGESCIVELSDGGVYISNRNHVPASLGVRSHDISRDGGKTFTEYGVDPELIEPVCHAGITRYDDKTILFSNPAKGAANSSNGWGRRQRMTVRASFDDCKTWPVEKLIDPGWAGYSAITACPDGTILCLYERGVQHSTLGGPGASRQDVAVARFNMAWLLRDDKIKEVIPPPVK